MILRYPSVSGLALAVTFSLFFIMQLLVATGADVIQDPPRIKIDPITYKIDEPEVIRKPPTPPALEIIKTPPVKTIPVTIDTSRPAGNGVPLIGTVIDEIPGPSEPFLPSAANRDEATAIVAIPPRYPQNMAARGIEGYVDVRFDITKTGSVANAVVTYSTNQGFERSAVQAITKWKFEPRVVNGAPQMQFGVEKRISYVLEQG